MYYRVAEGEFMDFAEVDNHDDFYSVDEGRVHVQDQRGYYIMYETALQDLKLVPPTEINTSHAVSQLKITPHIKILLV